MPGSGNMLKSIGEKGDTGHRQGMGRRAEEEKALGSYRHRPMNVRNSSMTIKVIWTPTIQRIQTCSPESLVTDMRLT